MPPLMELFVKLLFPAYREVIIVIYLIHKNITILKFIIKNGLKKAMLYRHCFSTLL